MLFYKYYKLYVVSTSRKRIPHTRHKMLMRYIITKKQEVQRVTGMVTKMLRRHRCYLAITHWRKI